MMRKTGSTASAQAWMMSCRSRVGTSERVAWRSYGNDGGARRVEPPRRLAKLAEAAQVVSTRACQTTGPA